MKRNPIAKSSEIVAGAIFVIAGLFFLALGAYFTSSADFKWPAMCIILMVSVSAIEAGAFWIKKYRSLTKKIDIERPPSLSRKLASAGVLAKFASDLLGAALVIAFMIAAAFLLMRTTAFRLNANFFIILAVLAAYFPVRSWVVSLLKPIFAKINEQGRKQLVAYEITGDGVWLNFQGWPEDKKRIFIRFDELTEVRVMDRYESMALQKYGIGPDVLLGLAASKEIVQYNMGKIARPDKLSWMTNVSGAKTLLLHGPKVLYLIGIQHPTGEDLVRAFESKR